MLEQYVAEDARETSPRCDAAERNIIHIAAGEKPRIADQVQTVIRDDLFHRDGRLIAIRVAGGENVLSPLSREALDDLINRRCCFLTYNKRGDEVRLDAPKWIAETIGGLGAWPFFREIRHVTGAPFLRPDGSVGGLIPGYDAASKVWADVPEGLTAPPDAPTDGQARAALEILLKVVDEYPFATAGSQAAYVSAALTIVGRRHIAGAVPLFIVDASKSGSGKTLLARVITMIGTGTDPGLANTGSNEGEFRKAITSFLMSGQPVLILDNQIGKIGGEAIDRLQTAGKWTDRLLNHNRIVTLRNDIVTLVTGNNSYLAADTGRRSLLIRLVPDCEYPEYRVFRRPDLLRDVRRNRHELALAALTILRWHIAKGYPATGALPFGSFEAWSKIVRDAVIGLGLPDPVTTQQAIKQLDEQDITIRRFVTALAAWNASWSGTAEELVLAVSTSETAAEVQAALNAMLAEKDFEATGRPKPAAVGYKLRNLKDRRVGSWALTIQGDCRKGTRWGLKRFDSCGDAEMPPALPKGISAGAHA